MEQSKPTTETALAVVGSYTTDAGEQLNLTPAIVKRYLVSGDPSKVTDQEVMLFIGLCRFRRLNPFIREAYLIKYSQDDPASMVVAKEVFLKRADAHPNFEGFRAGVILYDKETKQRVYEEGEMQLPGHELIGGWAEVHVKDKKFPYVARVNLKSYQAKRKDGSLMKNWKDPDQGGKPETMIRKIALVHALREAYPKDLGKMYEADEMELPERTMLSDAPIDIKAGKVGEKKASDSAGLSDAPGKNNDSTMSKPSRSEPGARSADEPSSPKPSESKQKEVRRRTQQLMLDGKPLVTAGSCPRDGVDVKESYCDSGKCQDRPGCPAWEEKIEGMEGDGQKFDLFSE